MRIWILLSLISNADYSFAASERINICGPSAHFFFANGMNNSQDEADDSARALDTLLNRRLMEQQLSKVSFRIAYNYDDRLPLELLEAYQQKSVESMELFWRWTNNWVAAPEWFQEIVKKFMKSYQENILSYSDTSRQVTLYKSLLENNHSIFVLGHSQGNLFTNATGERIIHSAITVVEELIRSKRSARSNFKISEKCMSWWNAITDIDRDDPQKCILRCASVPIDMGTFTCNSHCEYLCHCISQNL